MKKRKRKKDKIACRKVWTIHPATRIKKSDKIYKRSRDKNKWKGEML